MHKPNGLQVQSWRNQLAAHPELPDKPYALLLCTAIVLAAAAQLVFIQPSPPGVCSLSYDESARALIAAGLSWQNALRPWIWPPFYKILMGLFLHLRRDLFWVPRIATYFTGLLTVGALVYLAQSLFRDRWISVGTAFLSIFIWHRLLLSVCPMSEIFFFLFIILAGALVYRWQETNRTAPLVAGAVFLFLASTVRYEGCFFAFSLGCYLLYRAGTRRGLSLATFLGIGIILALFPVGWALLSLHYFGSLENLSLTRWQFVSVHGDDYVYAIKHSALRWLIADFAWNPFLILAIAAVMRFFMEKQSGRAWSVVFLAPLAAVIAVTWATLSVPMAVPWRSSGAWTLLLLPFTAAGMLMVARRLAGRLPQASVFSCLIGLAMLAPLARDARILENPHLQDRAEEFQAGRYVASLARPTDRLLIDAYDNIGYLNVLVGSNRPEAFLTTALADPVEAAVYLPARTEFRVQGTEKIVERYLTDRFDLAGKPDIARMRAENITYILAHRDRAVATLRSRGDFRELKHFNKWIIFALRGQPKAS